ncbi:MAG TPA: hypothetical protein VFF40_08080 [Acidimicrobiia bacterium]|nr:hypothetical protein [Acidimicrobiia bacterium]
MQPFERLRALARWSGSDDDVATEAAQALSGFDGDPAGLVVVCQRLLAHHPATAPLWWVCARVLCSPAAGEAAWEAWRMLRDDATATRLAALLPFPHDDTVAVFGRCEVARRALEERPDLATQRIGPRDGLAGVPASHLLVEATALSPDAARVPSGAPGVMRTFFDRGGSVWLIAPVGTVLPKRLYAAMDDAVAADLTAAATTETATLTMVERVAGPTGLDSVDRLGRRVDCPVAPELLRLRT